MYLEKVSDSSFQAAHPIKLDPTILGRVLRGVYVRNEKSAVGSLFTTTQKSERAFFEEEISFLAPLLSAALERAGPDQQVGFRLNQVGRPEYSQREGAGVGSSEPQLTVFPKETTAGTLFAHGLSLHLTLTEYRHRPERADTINMPNRRIPDPTGLNEREVLFVPETARRPDTYRPSWLLGEPTLTTLVIDYEVLAKLPNAQLEPATTPAAARPEAKPLATEGAAASAEELRSMKELVIKKDMEMEALKEEVRALRRQLAEREAELQKPQGKKKSVPNPQEASP